MTTKEQLRNSLTPPLVAGFLLVIMEDFTSVKTNLTVFVIAQVQGSTLFQKPNECYIVTEGTARDDYVTF